MAKADKAHEQSEAEGEQEAYKTKGKKAEELPICFVMMPFSEGDKYESGHFKRVYEYLIKPACLQAGFTPMRADDVFQSNHIVLDVLRLIVEAPMAVCDLSASNPNVLYELGVRQAFNKPVTLIKDVKTERIFDIQGLRDQTYDSDLRIDKVGPAVASLATAISDTYEARDRKGAGDVNSLIQLLGITAAVLPEKKEISGDTALILKAITDLSRRVTEAEKENIYINRETTPFLETPSRKPIISIAFNKSDKTKMENIVRRVTAFYTNVIFSMKYYNYNIGFDSLLRLHVDGRAYNDVKSYFVSLMIADDVKYSVVEENLS